jgi:PPOX class probable F420-dependent enzyme
VGEFDPRARFTQSPVARLATVAPTGVPHVVPVVFALDGDAPGGRDIVYTAVDAKPKTTRRLRRLANIENNPHVSLLVDHYADDWTQLWWVRADGVAAIHSGGEAMDTGYRLLRAKYPQYQSVPLNGPMIVVTVHRWSGWQAALAAPAPRP